MKKLLRYVIIGITVLLAAAMLTACDEERGSGVTDTQAQAVTSAPSEDEAQDTDKTTDTASSKEPTSSPETTRTPEVTKAPEPSKAPDTTDAHVHTWGEWQTLIGGACITESTCERYCSTCFEKEIQIFPKKDHTTVTVDAVAPTCTSVGYTE